MSLKYCLILCLYLLAIVVPARAQEGFPLPPLEVITPENAGEIVQVARIGNGVINEMAWSPNGITLGIASSLGVWLYDTDQPDAPPRLFEGQSGAQSLAFNPNGRYIASGGVDGSVWIWDIEAGEVVARQEDSLYTVNVVTFNSDGALLGFADYSGALRIWEWATDSIILEELFFSPEGAVFDITFNADSTRMGILLFGTAQVWNLADGTMSDPISFDDSTNYPYQIRFSDDGQTLVPLIGNDEKIYRAPTTDFLSIPQQLSMRNNLILVEFSGGLTRLWELTTGSLTLEYGGFAGKASATVFSPNGRLIARGGNTSTIEVLDSVALDSYARLFGHRRGVNNVAFSSDSALLASAGLDNLVGVWDIGAGGEIAPLIMLEGHTLGATAVAFSPDGTLIASGSYDGTIRLWGIPAES